MKIKKRYNKFLTILLVICSFLFVYSEDVFNYLDNEDVILKRTITDDESNSDENLEIYYIDVGQADSILIKSSNKYMLIDAGNNEDGQKLVTYFKSLGINKFDYVFGTHAHEDHIGGMDDVVNNFEIDKFYMPDVITTTSTFEDLLDALENKNIRFNTPKIGDNYYMSDINAKVVYVGNDEDDLNNSSIVLKLNYGKHSFLFMGDATNEVEKQILNKDIKSDVLKVGHHGSKYSSSLSFLKKVNPSYVVISVGKNNSYSHPNDIVLSRLQKLDVKVYRTDLNGTILVKSDGNNLFFDKIYTDTNG